jgi:hypothetical protein
MKWNLGRQPRRTPITIPLGRVELVTVVVLVLLALTAVIAVAVAISYSHMFDWALINGEPRWRAHLSPISVDGAMLAASLVMYADARMRNRKDWLAYLTMIAGVVWSVLANMNHDWVSPMAAKAIAAWPPLALAVSVELVLRFVRRLRERSEVQAHKIEKTQVRVEPKAAAAPRPMPAPQAIRSEPLSLDGLTVEMSMAGWAPSDYDGNLGEAMRGYLEKVNPEASGSELWTTVGPFFGRTGKDSGMGRTIARKFKEDQAAKSAAGE